jgi:chaperonin GroES
MLAAVEAGRGQVAGLGCLSSVQPPVPVGVQRSVQYVFHTGDPVFWSLSMKINPLDDRVVVRPNAAEEVTSGGIVLPDAAREKQQRGTVVAVGPGRLLDSGERSAPSVAVGDQVLFGKYGGTDIEVDGEEVKILRESDILAKLA